MVFSVPKSVNSLSEFLETFTSQSNSSPRVAFILGLNHPVPKDLDHLVGLHRFCLVLETQVSSLISILGLCLEAFLPFLE